MVSGGHRRSDSIRRRPPRRNAKHRILVVCEGEKTEPGYFKRFAHDQKSPLVHVEPVGAGGVPMTVVETAIRMQKAARDLAKKERDANREWDEVWAVFDVDDHPALQEAIALAQRSKILLAVSNPCFELWALLHFEAREAHIERGVLASKLRREYMPDYKKELDYELMRANYPAAVERARELHEIAVRLEDPLRNPTTGVHVLTQNIRKK